MKTSLWKLKRSLNNLAFRMSFIRLAPGSSRPLLPIAEFLIVGFTVFVLSGGLFVLTQGGQGLLNVASGYSFVYPGDIVYNADLRDGNPRSLYDVHEHTLCLSSQARLWIPGVRDDHGGNLHCITVRPNLRQDRSTLSYRRRALASNG